MKLRILENDDSCTGCGACVSSCPHEALSLNYNKEGFYYPHLDATKCVNCKACERVCHVIKESYPANEKISRNYRPLMVKAQSQDIIQKSSSGGMFSILANHILSENGIVYGARYNYEKEYLEHCSTDQCDLNELRKSKYIESYLGSIFKDVRNQLLNNRKVMFCGTPCQIDGLKTFLEERRVPMENLLLVRFICHGVLSNKFFTEYKHWIEHKVGSKICKIDFRPKTKGWRYSNLLLKFNNGQIIDEPHNYNYYYYYYQHNYLLRNACYTCERIKNENADITIADFWGIYKYKPENNDQEGISLVLLHTNKGEKVFQAISDECTYEELPQTAVDYIYKDINWRNSCLQYRHKMMEKVIKKGYMHVVIQTIGRKIFFTKQKDYFKKVIKNLLLWEKR